MGNPGRIGITACSIAIESPDPFFKVPSTTASTSGGPVQLPILYRQARNLDAFFLAERARVQAALEEVGATELQPTCEWGGRSLIGLACFEYRDTSIGSYNEIALAAMVVRKGAKARLGHWLALLADVQNPGREVGTFVLYMPVDTKTAYSVGREIWGFPKFITTIDYGRSNDGVKIILVDPDQAGSARRAIFELSGKLGAGIPGPSMSLLLYTHRQGHWLRTTVNVRGGVRLHGGGGLKLQISDSAHPMARTMITLGLQGARPVFVSDTDRFQSRLDRGVPWAHHPPTPSTDEG